jgi:hypothetical protein
LNIPPRKCELFFRHTELLHHSNVDQQNQLQNLELPTHSWIILRCAIRQIFNQMKCAIEINIQLNKTVLGIVQSYTYWVRWCIKRKKHDMYRIPSQQEHHPLQILWIFWITFSMWYTVAALKIIHIKLKLMFCNGFYFYIYFRCFTYIQNLSV